MVVVECLAQSNVVRQCSEEAGDVKDLMGASEDVKLARPDRLWHSFSAAWEGSGMGEACGR